MYLLTGGPFFNRMSIRNTYWYQEVVDFRKGFDCLCGIVREHLGLSKSERKVKWNKNIFNPVPHPGITGRVYSEISGQLCPK